MKGIKNSRLLLFAGMLSVSALTLFSLACKAQPLNQKKGFTHQDTLRGSITPERAWWDVLHYTVDVTPDYASKTIKGVVTVKVKKTNPSKVTLLQIDLQEPMILDSAIYCVPDKKDLRKSKFYTLPLTHSGNVWWLETKECNTQIGPNNELVLYYHGKPREAVRPPWDGGWIWTKDEKGRPWMSVACQGLGASVWYPCKDHQSDEPDNGARLIMRVVDSLAAVGNGRFVSNEKDVNGLTAWVWEVKNPINNYNIIPYIGKYVTWHEDYAGVKGKLDCDYWVLDYNLEKAKEQFKQAAQMLKCFEYWYGPYPFYEDSYKLVESPHLGMEHQSAVAYGNSFKNGYRGRDLSGSGWGEKWDFIIVHESGHEWFANSITSNDLADMWVHESFTNYSETLFTTCLFGVEAGNDYCTGTRKLIRNDMPIVGTYGVNQEGSGDMYYKGGNMLHTIRNAINNDDKYRQILHGLNTAFYHKTVDGKQVEEYISKESGIDFSKVFDQYLRTTQIPVLEYRLSASGISYRFTNCLKGFTLPLKVNAGQAVWVKPTEEWQTLAAPAGFDGKTFSVDRNFYVNSKQVN